MSGSTVITRLLYLVAAVLAAVAVVSAVVGGFRIEAGPLRISAGDPARVALQAALAWLAAVVLAPPLRRRGWLVLASVIAVLLSAVGDSRPRRVGDGAEYLAVALNLARTHRPSFSTDDKRRIEERLMQTPGFEDSILDAGVVGGDGREDLPHFWLYPLLATPFVALANTLGLHPNHGFTALNVLLVLLLALTLITRQRVTAAALLVAGPLIWWIDKAHAEVFLVVMMAAALLLIESHPAIALIAAGLAAAQNPATAIVLVGVSAFALTDRQRGRTTIVGLVVAIGAAAAHPLYYLLHVRLLSPLLTFVGADVPGLRALLSPLLDPNLGLLPYAPVLVLLAVIGFSSQPLRMRMLIVLLAVGLLFVFTRQPNANHGGTPTMSRYALWLLPCLVPLIVGGVERLERRRPLLMTLAVVASLSLSWYVFRPSEPDRGGDTPSALASMLWSRWPGVDNPLPEVFAERVAGIDGLPFVPTAIPGCRKALVRGNGREALWPFPCAPREAPPSCAAEGALCYVNDGRFDAVPRQRSFMYDAADEWSWSVGNRGRLPELLQRLGSDARSTRLGQARRTAGGTAISIPYVVEGSNGTAVWITAASAPDARLRIRVAVPSVVEIRRPISDAEVDSRRVPAGEHVLALPFSERVLVLVMDAS